MTVARVVRAYNPFPGLRPYEWHEEHLFFGRAKQVDALLGRLRWTRFLAIVGPSGSGKSSLVRAGMLPALNGGLMAQAGSRWRIAVLRPGSEPIANLARALSHALNANEKIVEGSAERELQVGLLHAVLARGALGLAEAVADARLARGENVLVIVDQFEELFRFTPGASGAPATQEATAFVKLLLAAVGRSPDIYVAITMRSDFLGECSQFHDLPEAINDGLFLVPRLTRAQQRSAIEGPIGVVGCEIAPRLVTRLLNDLGDDPDQLPVLQHALMRSWNLWDNDHAPGEPLDVRHYDATGGLAQALSLHANEVYDNLPNDRQREVAEKLFKALTEQGADKRGIRRPLRLREACAIVGSSAEELRSVVDAFRAPDCLFLMPAADVPLRADTFIDISHESLMRIWTRLKTWAEQESESAQIYRRVAESAALYGEGKAAYLREPELSLGLNWRRANQPTAAWARRYAPSFVAAMGFLEASAAERDKEDFDRSAARRTQLRRWRTFSAILVILSLAMAAATCVAILQAGNAEKARTQALREAAANAAASNFYDGYASNDTNNAIASYGKAISGDPALVPAYEQRGLAYEKKAQEDRHSSWYHFALEDFDRVIGRYANNAQAFLQRGAAYHLVLNDDLAIADTDRAIEYAPKNPAAYEQLSSIYMDRDDNEGAIADFERQIARDPGNELPYEQLTVFYKRIPSGLRAIQDFTRMIQRRPDRAFAYTQRAYAYERRHDGKHALADFDRAIELDPHDAQLLLGRGDELDRERRFAAAIRDADAAIQEEPNNGLTFVRRGGFHTDGGFYDLAIADYDRAIGLGVTGAYSRRAAVFMQKRDYRRAVADYGRLLQLSPNGANYVSRGDAYVSMKAYGKGFADYERAIELGTTSAYISRAALYGNIGDDGRALADYGKMIQLRPDDFRPLRDRGIAYFNNGRYERAKIDLDAAAVLARSDTYLALWRQLVRYKMGATTSEELAADASQLTPNTALDPIVGMFLGRVHIDDALTAARNGNTVDDDRMCIASFFVGEYLLTMKDERGRRYLNYTTNLCFKTQLEYLAARAELSRTR